MKLHGTRKLGSTSALLNNIDKYVKKSKIWPFLPWKKTFRAIQANLSFDSSLVPFFGSSMPNREKVTEQFWSKWPPNAKRAKFDLVKWPLERFNHIYFSICDLCHPKEATCQRRKKVTKEFLRLTPPPLLTDGQTDRQTDDGQICIGKAPLPLGWWS